MARLMIVAGGEWQCPIVKKAKEMGHEVICTNLYKESPAFQYSDYSEVANVLDRNINLQIAQKYRPEAVLTDQSDIAVPTVAYIAENLGIKGIGHEVAELFTNKNKMREFCKKNGFPYPKYKLCFSIEDAIDFFSNSIKKTAIIKPIDSQSSRGIHIIKTVDELIKYYADTISYSNSEKAVLIEEYINGKEFTVDGIKTNSDYFVTAISKKEHFEYNSSIAKELLFSNYDDEYNYDKLREINSAMVLQMGLPFGLTHAEYKYMDGEFYLIEIAARGGGTKISSDIVPIMSGINSNEVYIDLLLGNDRDIKMTYNEKIFSVLGFFDFKPGEVRSINFKENLSNIHGIVEVVVNVKPGDYIQPALDDRSRMGHYILYATELHELRRLQKLVEENVIINYKEED